MALVHSASVRVTCSLFELWHYLQKIIYKALEKVNVLLRLKYMKQRDEIYTRIIVPMPDEDF